MGFGPTLLGGVVGAAVGVAVQLALEMVARIQAPWCAVLIGVLTGFGVRQATKAKFPGVSYARGALAGLLALGAIFASPQLIAAIMKKQDVSKMAAPVISQTKQADEGEDVAAAPVAPAANMDDLISKDGVKPDGKALLRRGPERGDLWQAIYMIVGAFLAYELGRGSERSRPIAAAPVHEPAIATDPSN